MTTITTPHAGIPIGTVTVGGQRVDVVTHPEFVRFFESLVIRAGGVTGPGSNDLAISAFEDAGIEETKAALAAARDEIGQIASLRAEVDALRAIVQGLQLAATVSTEVVAGNIVRDAVLPAHTVQGITVGLGANAVATNTAFGAAALSSGSLSGTNNLALGNGAGSALTTGNNNTVIGSLAGTAGLADTVLIGAGATERIRIDNIGDTYTSGRMVIGMPGTSATPYGGKLQVSAPDATANAFLKRYSADTSAPNLFLIKTRGSTVTDNATVNNGDVLGSVTFAGTQGTGTVGVAAVTAIVDGVVSATALPSQLTFTTTPAGSLSGSMRMGIRQDGVVEMYIYGAGTATFSASGVISSVSDETYKVKDGVIADPIPMLMALEPGYYYGKPEANMGTERQLGFYAQNVRAAIGPEAAPDPHYQVDENGKASKVKKPWGYFDRSVLAVAVAAIKVQQVQITAYTARIAALEAANLQPVKSK